MSQDVIFPSVRFGRNHRFRYWDGTKSMSGDFVAAAKRGDDGVGEYGREVLNVSVADMFGKLLPCMQSTAESVPSDECSSILSPAEAYMYASADLDLPQLSALRRDVRPLAQLHIDPESPPSALRRFMWVGSPNASAPFHYDTSHNLYAQLCGTKRFYLLPPEEHLSMYVYPVSHPGDRQAQVPWDPSQEWTLGSSRFPLFYAVESVHVADVAPGETLLLPAMWFHHVVATSASVSVNVWQLSADAIALENLLSDAVPLWQRTWPADRTLLVVQRFLKAVLSLLADTRKGDREGASVLGGHDTDVDSCSGLSGSLCVNDVVRDVVETQYAPLGLWDARATPVFPCSISIGRGLDEALSDHVNRSVDVFKGNVPFCM